MIHRACYRESEGTAVQNQLIYVLRSLDNQRTKTNADVATGRAQGFCWLLECDWARAM